METSIIQRKMESARQLAHALAADDVSGSIDSIYIAGSLTARLGNATSDADLFVLQNPGVAISDGMKQYNVDGNRVDVERYSVDYAERAADEVISFTVQRDNLTALHALPDKIDFIVRLHTSETVIGSPALDNIKRRVSGSILSVRRTCINYSAIVVYAFLEDFIGAVLDADFDTAALVGQELVVYAGKALTAALSDLYFTKKWVYKQLARNPIEGFPIDQFTDYQRGVWTSRGAAGAEALIFFAQTCVTASQLLSGWDVPVAAWPSWTANCQGDGLWRHPGYLVLRHPDGILLHWELRRQLLLKEHTAVVWALCDGRGPEEIMANVKLLSGHVPALRALTAERVAGILRSLQDRGLVSREAISISSTV